MNKEYYGVRRIGDHDEAYIVHAGREKGWKMPNAKYIARLITSNGTYKYIYNQAQLAAAKGGQAMSRVKRTAQNAAGGLRSIEKKYTNKRGGVFTQVDNALGLSRSGAQVKKARATRAKVYGTQNGLQKALKNAGSAVSKAAGRAGKALSDASGLTARKELKKAARTAERVSKGISSKRGKYESYNPNDSLEKRRNSTKKRYQEKAVKARDKYNKTLLGRAESAGRSIGDIAEYAGNAAGKAVNAAGKAVNDYKAQQNSKRIAKKVSKKNAEYKKKAVSRTLDNRNASDEYKMLARKSMGKRNSELYTQRGQTKRNSNKSRNFANTVEGRTWNAGVRRRERDDVDFYSAAAKVARKKNGWSLGDMQIETSPLSGKYVSRAEYLRNKKIKKRLSSKSRKG